MSTRVWSIAMVSVVLVLTAVCLFTVEAGAWVAPPWIDKVTMEVMVQKNLAKTGNFDPYFKQLETVSEAAVKGDFAAKRRGMNRFLEMLETKEGGISAEAAHRIFATVVKSVPYAVLLPLKSEDKLDAEEKALVDRMKRLAASIKNQDERAALAF